jgi:hypothetical protein
VQVVQVDDVDSEPAEAGLGGPLDVGTLAAQDAGLAVCAGPVDAELGRQLHLAAAARDRPADQYLVVAGAVGVRRVQERHPRIERGVDGGDRLVPVGRAVPFAHPHAAEALGGDGEVA